MEIDKATYEQQMLEHTKRQTIALEALRNFALIVLVLLAIGVVGWIVWALN